MIQEISGRAIATAALALGLLGFGGYTQFCQSSSPQQTSSKLEQTVSEETGTISGARHKGSTAETTESTAPYVPPATVPSAPTASEAPATVAPLPEAPSAAPRVSYEAVTVPISFTLGDVNASSLWRFAASEELKLKEYATNEGILPPTAQDIEVLVLDNATKNYVSLSGSIEDKINHLTSLGSVTDSYWSKPSSDTKAFDWIANINYTVTSKGASIARAQMIELLSLKNADGTRRYTEDKAKAAVNQMFNNPNMLKSWDVDRNDPAIKYVWQAVEKSDGLQGDNIRADTQLDGLYAVRFTIPVTRAAIPNNKTDLDGVVAKLSGFGINVDLNRSYSLSKPTAQPTHSQTEAVATKPSLLSRFTNKVSKSYSVARETVSGCLDEMVHAAVPSTDTTIAFDLEGRQEQLNEKKTYSSIESRLADLSPIHSRAAQPASTKKKSGWFSRAKNYVSNTVADIAENTVAAVENIGYAAVPRSERVVRLGINEYESTTTPSMYETLKSNVSKSAKKSMQYAKVHASELNETLRGAASNLGYAFKPSSEKFTAMDLSGTYNRMHEDSIGDSYERNGTFLRLFSGGSFEAPKQTASDYLNRGFSISFSKLKQAYQATENLTSGFYSMGKDALYPGGAEFITIGDNNPLKESAFERMASRFEGLAKHYI